jgi:hypothetical protein
LGVGYWVLGTGLKESLSFFITLTEMKYKMRREIPAEDPVFGRRGVRCELADFIPRLEYWSVGVLEYWKAGDKTNFRWEWKQRLTGFSLHGS